MMGLGVSSHYVYYRRIINTPINISGPYVFNGTGTFIFYPDYLNITSCSWSVEPADMFQVSSGTGDIANLSYKTPFVYLAPKATITFTFSYGCDNHYTVSKEFDLRIPTTTISGNAISEGFIIDANSTVTVTGNIKNNKNAKTIVPIGTKLVLDGGTMTSNEDGMWQGIEVWGNSSTHQQSFQGQLGQGFIVLRNGAVIEDAKCAVELWRPGHYSTTGGIIHATDAMFRNNAMAVRAVNYNNYSYVNGAPLDYNGSFNNCSFVIDEDYLGTEVFKKHINLADVNGISFSGCDFSAKRAVQGVDVWCSGINAYNAGFTVQSPCASNTMPCPDADLDKTTFTGFCNGIYATNSGNRPRSFIVRDAVFTNNDRGIRAINTGFPTILGNEFNISQETYCNYNYGIYLEGVSGFCIEENTFQPVSSPGGSTIGIAVYDSYGINDIYLNHFENLSGSVLAKGQNALTSAAGDIVGLTLTCNTNEGNHNDFRVYQKDGEGDIQTQQGSYTMPAGNTFDATGYHFMNQGTHWIDYYHNNADASQMPNTSKIYRVYLHGTPNSNPCYTHYGSGPVDRSLSEKAALESDYLSAYTAYLNLEQLYESRIDGGNTATQVADINAATPADMWQLRARLLGLSPYVSGDVLTAASDRSDVFSDPVLFEILSANPDELKKDSLINYLEHKDNPLPSYMIDMLRQVAAGATARTALIAQMSRYRHDYSLAAGDIVRSNLNDSVANPTELRNWLGNLNDIAADRMVVASYLEEGDSLSAFTLATMLPDLYGLQGEELVDHGGYMRMIQLYQSLHSSSRTVFEMTETEMALVDSIAENGVGNSQRMAKNLLDEIYGTVSETCIDPEISDPLDGGRSWTDFDGQLFNQTNGFKVSVGPNPASTWTVVDYVLPSTMPKGTLVVANTLGTVMVSAELEGHQGQKVIDLRGLANGVYVFTVRCGELVQTGKLVITQ